MVWERGAPFRSQTPAGTCNLRYGNDARIRPLLRHRKLFALFWRTCGRHPSLLPAGFFPRGFSHSHRRKPCERSADTCHVWRRPRPKDKLGRIRFPASRSNGQPSVEVRGVWINGKTGYIRQRHTCRLRTDAIWRYCCRAGNPSDRLAGSHHRSTPQPQPDRRLNGRNSVAHRTQRAHAHHHSDQAHGRRIDGISSQ